jgi:hypothetical protein
MLYRGRAHVSAAGGPGGGELAVLTRPSPSDDGAVRFAPLPGVGPARSHPCGATRASGGLIIDLARGLVSIERAELGVDHRRLNVLVAQPVSHGHDGELADEVRTNRMLQRVRMT